MWYFKAVLLLNLVLHFWHTSLDTGGGLFAKSWFATDCSLEACGCGEEDLGEHKTDGGSVALSETYLFFDKKVRRDKEKFRKKKL